MRWVKVPIILEYTVPSWFIDISFLIHQAPGGNNINMYSILCRFQNVIALWRTVRCRRLPGQSSVFTFIFVSHSFSCCVYIKDLWISIIIILNYDKEYVGMLNMGTILNHFLWYCGLVAVMANFVLLSQTHLFSSSSDHCLQTLRSYVNCRIYVHSIQSKSCCLILIARGCTFKFKHR